MRADALEFAREEIADLAKGYGMTVAFEAIGLGQVATVIDALQTLSDIIAADDTRSAAEKEGATMLVEDMLWSLTA